MNIGFVIYGNLNQVSGGYTYDRFIVDYLSSRGDEVDVISIKALKPPITFADNFSPDLYYRIKNAKFDCLLEDELCHGSLFLLNKSLKGTLPIISVVHHLKCNEYPQMLRQPMCRLVERQYLKTVDAVICNSVTTLHSVQLLTESSIPSLVALPGKDRLRACENPFLDGPLQIVFLANIIERKRLHDLLDALSMIPESEWRLTIVGSLLNPHYTRKIAGKIRELGFDRHVQYIGYLNDNELSRLLERSHVLALPSQYEGIGLAYIEAMGFGIPSIATNQGGAGELITHGHNGYLVEPGDLTSLSKHIQDLSQDRSLLLQMKRNAIQRYAFLPDWDETCQKIRDFITTVAGDFKSKSFSKERFITGKKGRF